MENLCIRCKGKGLCGKPCKILERFKDNYPKVKMHFSGPSPPEIFVGRVGYPNVNSGILAPSSYETKHSILGDAEEWSKYNLSVANILRLRGQLVYGRAITNIKKNNHIRDVINELAMTHKSVSTEFFLKKRPTLNVFSASSVFKPMTNPAPIKKVLLEENTKVLKKVDYLVNDNDVKAVDAIIELRNNLKVDHLQKLLSAGIIGQKQNRKMVPTRWSITAVDDIVSKNLLKKIRDYSEINEIVLLEGNYLGNYMKVLILPGNFCFEVIEVWQTEEEKVEFMQDYEGFNGRKDYAKNVTGGYYATRIAICEYLDKIKRQGSVFVLREISDEYYAPLGVGIVRETARRAIKNKPLVFDELKKVIDYIKRGFVLKKDLLERSWILENYGKQKRLNEFF